MADIEVIHAYRHLYRQLLYAVKFAEPARFVARDLLRAGFREKGAKLDRRSTVRTIRFLDAAARARGIEHNVVKNCLHVAYFRHYASRLPWRLVEQSMHTPKKDKELEEHIQRTAFKHYDMTIAMLNKSVGLCLR